MPIPALGAPPDSPVSLSRRTLTLGLLGATAQSLLPRSAGATTAIPLTLDELVGKSQRVVLATPSASQSAWEFLGAKKRLVTIHTLLAHEDWIASGGEPQKLFVRTLGGRSGELAQKVFGEAELPKHEPTLLFLHRLSGLSGSDFVVTAMAQGHYPIVTTGGSPSLRVSPALPALTQRRNDPAGKPINPAFSQLSALSLADARSLVQTAAQRIQKGAP